MYIYLLRYIVVGFVFPNKRRINTMDLPLHIYGDYDVKRENLSLRRTLKRITFARFMAFAL